MIDRSRTSLLTLIILPLFVAQTPVFGCTIVSAVAEDGTVWNMNNEDGPQGVANFLSVFPQTDSTRFGYYTLAYFTPSAGAGGNIQGGMNEAGLTFDFNSIPAISGFEFADRLPFPEGDAAILPYLLGNMETTGEVVAFFEKYWFANGFTSAQMHVADRSGQFAIISASGVKLSDRGKPLVSTNFDICGGAPGTNCWRYPIARSRLETGTVGLGLMQTIAEETAVSGSGNTLYTNIQNLTTGEIWITSYHSPGTEVHIKLNDFLARGKRIYSFSDLDALAADRATDVGLAPSGCTGVMPPSATKLLVGNYRNGYVGEISVADHEDGLAITFFGTNELIFEPCGGLLYRLPGEEVVIDFELDGRDLPDLLLYQEGYWSSTAEKIE